MWDGAELRDQKGLSTELFGERARTYITNHRDEPFFLTLAFNAVHNFTHQLPAQYLEDNGLEGYRDWDPAVEEYYDWYRGGRSPNNPEGRAHYQGQLHYLDVEVGRMLDHLDGLELAENTIVIYVGDNGGSTPIYADNGPLRGSKYTLYEGGIRVPLIISWPGRFGAGISLPNVVSAMDLFPTVCNAVGQTPPPHLDGYDLMPLFNGSEQDLHHDVLVWDTGHETAVRAGRWKLKTAQHKQHADYEMVELELGTFLYDLEADPGESTDLAAANPAIVARLGAYYEAWRKRVQK